MPQYIVYAQQVLYVERVIDAPDEEAAATIADQLVQTGMLQPVYTSASGPCRNTDMQLSCLILSLGVKYCIGNPTFRLCWKAITETAKMNCNREKRTASLFRKAIRFSLFILLSVYNQQPYRSFV